MDKPNYLASRARICADAMQTIADTVWGALGQAKTPAAAREALGALGYAPDTALYYVLQGDRFVPLSTTGIEVGYSLNAILLSKITDLDLDWSDPDRLTGQLPTLTGMIDGTNDTFELHVDDAAQDYPVATPASAMQLRLYVNDVAQEPGVHYTLDESNITFATPPQVGANIWGIYYALVAPDVVTKSTSVRLMYQMADGQTTITLSDADFYSNAYTLLGDEPIDVYINGERQPLDEGLGAGYSVNYGANQINLVAPATAGDRVHIDILTPQDAFVEQHASSHAIGGTDPLTPADIGAEVAGAAAAVQSQLVSHTGQSDIHAPVPALMPAQEAIDGTATTQRTINAETLKEAINEHGDIYPGMTPEEAASGTEPDTRVVSPLVLAGAVRAHDANQVFETAQDARDGWDGERPVITLGCNAAGDGGGGLWRPLPEAAPGTYVDNTGTILVPTGSDGSVALGRDRSYHPMGIPVQAFGIIGDGSCEWAKWEAMMEALGGPIGYTGLDKGATIYVDNPVSDSFVVRFCIFPRNNITINLGPRGVIQNKNVTSAPTSDVPGDTRITDTHQAVFWVGRWNPGGLQLGLGAGTDDVVGQLEFHALEDGNAGERFVTLSSAADAAKYNVGDIVYIFNNYRQMMCLCTDVDPVTGKISLNEPLFWDLSKLYTEDAATTKNYCFIFNFSTEDGRGTHRWTFRPYVDPEFTAFSEPYVLPAHAVQNFFVKGVPGAKIISDNWVPINNEALYIGGFSDYESYGRGAIYCNAQTHAPWQRIRFFQWNYVWEMADGYRNSPMLDCDFYNTPLRDLWAPTANQAYIARTGQMCHHRNVRVFDSIDWSNIAAFGPFLYSDDGFCFGSTLENFELHFYGNLGNAVVFQMRNAFSQEGGQSIKADPGAVRAIQPRNSTYRNWKIHLYKDANNLARIFDTVLSYPTADGGPKGIVIENFEVIMHGSYDADKLLSYFAGDTSGRLINCKIPGYIWVNAQDRLAQLVPDSLMENWEIDRLECDGVHQFVYDIPVAFNYTTEDPEIVKPITIDGNVGDFLNMPRIAQNATILRRGMLPLVRWNEYGWGVALQSTGDIFRFDIPPGLPWVIEDEIEFILPIQVLTSNFVARTLTFRDRATSEDSWNTILEYTHPIGAGPADPLDRENMWHECVLKMRVLKVDRVVPADRDSETPTQILWTATYRNPLGTSVHSVCARGEGGDGLAPLIDLRADGRQLSVYNDIGDVSSGGVGAICRPRIRTNLRWWPR